MLSHDDFEKIKNRLVGAYNPHKIYLFGSYAWGIPDEESDIDLLIVVDIADENPYVRPYAAYDVLFGMGVAKDVLVYTRQEFEAAIKDSTSLIHKIVQEGRLLYARA